MPDDTSTNITQSATSSPLKPGPVSSHEDALRRHMVVREVARLLIHGHSERAIARQLGIARSTVRRMEREVRALADWDLGEAASGLLPADFEWPSY